MSTRIAATHPPELADLVDAGLPLVGGAREGASVEVDEFILVPPIGRRIAQGTILALLGVQIVWLALLVLIVVAIVH